MVDNRHQVIPIKKNKIGLLCAGGGITGGVYEVGCLKAFDDFLVNRRVTDFDLYVGTSVGSIIATFLANGTSPHELFKALIGTSGELSRLRRGDCLGINYREFWARMRRAPFKMLHVLRHYFKDFKEIPLSSLMLDFLVEMMPSGIFHNDVLERYVQENFRRLGYSDSFNDITKELYLTACDIDRGERVVFGEAGYRNIPVSLAIKASTALPLIYKPVRVGGHEYVDGAIKKTLHLDVAQKHGASLAICINPIVPYVNDVMTRSLPLLEGWGNYVSDMGLFKVLDQAFRTIVYSRRESAIEKVQRVNPDLDIILFEPLQKDLTMFSYNMMNYSSRVLIAEHGFNTVREQILSNFSYYKAVLAKHGIEISDKVVNREYEEMQENQFNIPSIIRNLSDQVG